MSPKSDSPEETLDQVEETHKEDSVVEHAKRMLEESRTPPRRSGEILKEARLEKGLSLEAVHESTKIPMDALRAIEEGYTIRTLSPFYIKGFLKIYSTYLNVDISDVLQEFKEEKPAAEVKTTDVDSDFEFRVKQTMKKYFTHQRKRQLITIAGGILGLFILFKTIVFLNHYFHNRPKKDKGQVVKKVDKKAEAAKKAEQKKKAAAAAEAKKKEKKAEANRPKPTPAPAPTPPAAAPVAAVTTPATNPAPVAQPVAQAPAPTPSQPIEPIPVVSQPVSKEINLTVRALKKSWLRVKADDRTVFQSTLNKGVVETWRANDQIEITGKNIIHLEFELNGNLIGTLGRKNRKAKSVTITKDGLSVTK